MIKYKKMFKRIINVYNLYLYEINFNDQLDVDNSGNISYGKINVKNVEKICKKLKIHKQREFYKMLSYNDIGIFAMVDKDIVGYGWSKFKNSADFFYKIDECYLCRFYVRAEYRGENIYPNIIKKIMNVVNEKHRMDKFYISCDKNNISSIRGIKKIGFSFKMENRFIRAFKITFFKYKL